MCFSAAASIVAGTTFTGVGAVTVRKAKNITELPFASFPLIFGIQQLVEGAVWLSLSSPAVNAVFAHFYTFFSHVFWPFITPFAVWFMEPDPYRKKVLSMFLGIGALTSIYLLFYIIQYPVVAQALNNCINYQEVLPHAEWVVFFYVLATCFSCLFSSYRMVNVFGATLLVSFMISYQIYATAFLSVWCFFAAILSVIVYMHFKLGRIKGWGTVFSKSIAR